MALNYNFGSKLGGLKVYLRLLRCVREYWFMFALGALGTIAVSGVDAGVTWLIKPIIDQGFVDRNHAFVHWLPIILLLVFALRSVSNFAANYCMNRVSRNVIMDLRQQLFKQMLHLPANFYDQHSSGYLLSTIIYNVNQVAGASSSALINLLREGSTMIGMILVMLLVSWRLTLTLLIVAPAITWIVKVSGKRLRRLSHSVQDSVANVTHLAEESIECYKVIRLCNGESREIEKFSQATRHNRNQDLKIVVTNSINGSLIQSILVLPAIALLSVSAASVNVTAGSFAAIITAMFGLLRPARRLSGVQSAMQNGIAGAASVFELLDEKAERDEGTKVLQSVQGHIEYKHVNFSYESAPDVNVLNNIDFKVEAGKTVAIVGRSGSGKTTLVSLLPRFYDLQLGSIKIDGHDIREYTLLSLREHLAMVSQHTNLFNDTIANNIAYGQSSTVTREAIEIAARDAYVLEFAEQLPNGLDTMVGENGVLLSGGQKQRVAIARALLKNSPILILDEATSALDTHSERYIQEALARLMQNRTTLVIAHRLSTIEKADKILVMENGKIVEEGSHRELLELAGVYSELYNMQFQ